MSAWCLALEPHVAVIQNVSVVVVTILMSYFSLVFGELVPKRIAMQKAEALSFAFIGVLRGVAIVTRPFVKFLSLSTNLVVRLFGIDPHADEENVTEEEIRMMVDVGEEKGVIEGVQKEMINNIFEFDDITAEDIMTPRTDVARSTSRTALPKPCASGWRKAIPACRYTKTISTTSSACCISRICCPMWDQEIPKDVSIRHLLREAFFIPGTKKCGELFSEMTEKHIQMAIVVDEYGGVAGIVSMEDLLESIVGNIQDEFDHEEEEVMKLSETAFDVDGLDEHRGPQ